MPMRTLSFFTPENALMELLSVNAAPVNAEVLIKFLLLNAAGIAISFFSVNVKIICA